MRSSPCRACCSAWSSSPRSVPRSRVLVVTAAVIYTPGAYRTARALAVNIAAMDFVRVARARGEAPCFIMRDEILPNMLLPLLTDFGLRFVYVVLLLSGLSFLGLGMQPPHADWGSLVRENIEGLAYGAPAVIMPAIAIATLTHRRQSADRQPVRSAARCGMRAESATGGGGWPARRAPTAAQRHRRRCQLHYRPRRGARADRRIRLGQDHDRPRADGLCAPRLPHRRRAASASANTDVPRAVAARALSGLARPHRHLCRAERRCRLQSGAAHHAAGDRKRADPQADAAQRRPKRRLAPCSPHSPCPIPNASASASRTRSPAASCSALLAAMALITDPELVILDEPTTALDVTTQIEVLRAFKRVVRERRTTALYVSHDLAVVAQMADRIVVLRDGEVQESGADRSACCAAPAHPLHAEPARRGRRRLAPRRRTAQRSSRRRRCASTGSSRATARPMRAACRVIPVLRDIELTIQTDSVLGVIGESGCGKSTLAQVIAGLLPPARGSDRTGWRAAAAARRAAHARAAAPHPDRVPVADVALNPAHTRRAHPGAAAALLSRHAGRRVAPRVAELLDMVRLPPALADRYPHELSGGQKQRVNLARALAAEPQPDPVRRSHLGAGHAWSAPRSSICSPNCGASLAFPTCSSATTSPPCARSATR